MAEPSSGELNVEQQQLRAALIERYGVVAFNRAMEMSGVRTCLQALATDALSAQERHLAFMRAGMHLSRLHASFMTAEQSAALSECAKRIDAALDMWVVDEIEQRDGLPPQGDGALSGR